MIVDCQHEWVQDLERPGRWVCGSCPHEAVACLECGRPVDSVMVVCERCINRFRNMVLDVAIWLEEATFGVNTFSVLRAIRYDGAKVSTSGDDTRLPHGLDQIVPDVDGDPVAGARHPEHLVDELARWAALWAQERYDETPPARDDVARWLGSRTQWAMLNRDASFWVDYAAQLPRLRGKMRWLLGLAPEVDPTPCPHCGGRIQRTWTKDGLEDVRECSGCATTWPDATRLHQLHAVVVRALPDVLPGMDLDADVTPAQARLMFPDIPAATLRWWIHKEIVPTRGTTVRGEQLVRVSDVAAAQEARLATIAEREARREARRRANTTTTEEGGSAA